MATQNEYIKTALRLPRSLHADIQASAKELGRSMNAEIIARLQASFEHTSSAADIAKRYGITGEVDFHKLSSDDAANIVADKVVERLFGASDFMQKVQRALLDADKDGHTSKK